MQRRSVRFVLQMKIEPFSSRMRSEGAQIRLPRALHALSCALGTLTQRPMTHRPCAVCYPQTPARLCCLSELGERASEGETDGSWCGTGA